MLADVRLVPEDMDINLDHLEIEEDTLEVFSEYCELVLSKEGDETWMNLFPQAMHSLTHKQEEEVTLLVRQPWRNLSDMANFANCYQFDRLVILVRPLC